ncbi:ATP-binding protein [candidate division KSB1 bacterium]|nr:ATP-binding protein [candidate division KSB1 bacterium]
MKHSDLKTVILDQSIIQPETNLIEREKFQHLINWHQNQEIIIISGMRRCGKSTLLHQMKQQFDGYFLNFDDERLISCTVDDFQQMDEIFHELFGTKNTYYFDEIQNVHGWERFVRRLHDSRKKIYIAGSNARLLSRELGTHLTGRYLQSTLFPFSLNEYIRLKKISLQDEDFFTTQGRAKLKNSFNSYLVSGGIPEYLKSNKKEYIRSLFESILYRDVLVRYNISNEKNIKEAMLFALSNIGNQISFNKLKNTLGIKSSTTVKDYFSYFENSYLIFLLSKFSYSSKENIYANKKLYLIDNGFSTNLGFRHNDDNGRFLENLVLVELKRQEKDIFYFQEKQECDFVIKTGLKVEQAIQVCYEITDENRSREVNGLLEALQAFDISNGIILTYDQMDELSINNKTISIKPAWHWLLRER